jgi:hypothetical protein
MSKVSIMRGGLGDWHRYRADWRDSSEMLARVPAIVARDLAPPPPGELRHPAIRPLQAFLLLDGQTQTRVMQAYAHDAILIPPRVPVDIGMLKPGAASAAAACFARMATSPGAKGDRLRVGYVSSDFGDHPLGHDFGHFFGLHDRSRFEVFAFNTRATPDQSMWRRRIVKEVEADPGHWVDVSGVTEDAAAVVIATLRIDVLVNLNGYTPGSRNRIFALRPAPVQVMWKGWAGSIGADYVPWLISDRISSPPEMADQYTEKVLYTPYSYATAVARATRSPCPLHSSLCSSVTGISSTTTS